MRIIRVVGLSVASLAASLGCEEEPSTGHLGDAGTDGPSSGLDAGAMGAGGLTGNGGAKGNGGVAGNGGSAGDGGVTGGRASSSCSDGASDADCATPATDAGGNAADASALDASALDAGDAGPSGATPDGDAGEPAGLRASSLAAGSSHTCAVLEDGSVRCWGYDDFAQLGGGAQSKSTCASGSAILACSTRPVAVADLHTAKSVSLGDYFSCAVLADGSVRCWGMNDTGELGIGTSTGPSTCKLSSSAEFPCALRPVALPGLAGVQAVAASDEEHSCALLASGGVRCWGLNGGQLGNGTAVGPSTCTTMNIMLSCAPSPVSVSGLASAAVAVDTATFHSCAVLDSGTVQCWGGNLDGRLGDGTTTDSYSPTTVAQLTDAKAVALGGEHSCALRKGGTVVCWGNNRTGQLGASDAALPASCTLPGIPGTQPYECSTVPVGVKDLANVTAISAGGNHNCALLEDGTVQCWGQNSSGELGVPATGPSTCTVQSAGTTPPCARTPVAVPGLDHVVAIAAGAEHTCALIANGAVRCWGRNVTGALGNGTTVDSATPVTVRW